MLLSNAEIPETSSSSSSASSPDDMEVGEEDPDQKRKKMKLTSEEMTAFEDLVDDLQFNEDKIDEHLDLTLDEEMNFLAKYKSLL